MPGAMVVVERGRAAPSPPGRTGFGASREKKYGETVLWYVHAAQRPAPPSRTGLQEAPCAAPSAPGRSTRSPTGTSTSSRRASRLFDEVSSRSAPTSARTGCSRRRADRDDAARLRRPANVSVEGFTGLVTTFCAERDVDAIVKGLRAASDFDYELQMAQMNSSLTGVETVFIPTSPETRLRLLVAGQGGRGLRRRRLGVRPGVRPRPAEGTPRLTPTPAREASEKHAESARDDSARWDRGFAPLTWPDTIRGDLLWPRTEEVNP